MQQHQIRPVRNGLGSEVVPELGEVVDFVPDDGEASSEEITSEQTDGEMDLAVSEDVADELGEFGGGGGWGGEVGVDETAGGFREVVALDILQELGFGLRRVGDTVELVLDRPIENPKTSAVRPSNE